MLALGIFTMTYIGVALGRIPGLVIDRTGIALLGAIAMVVFGVLTPQEAVASIDLPTILLLFALMVLSAQLRLGGFYTWTASRIIFLLHRPRLFLLSSMAVSALLSSVLANDIVCFAFTPVLAVSVLHARLNPLPFLIGLAVSSTFAGNLIIIGSIANLIVVERAENHGIHIAFWKHAAAGIPVTLASLIVLLFWIQIQS